MSKTTKTSPKAPEGIGLTRMNNEFAFRLLGRLPKEGNLFFSGFNIRMALAMVYAGARKDTAREMCDVLGFTKDSKLFHLAMSKVKDDLEGSGVVQIANNVWVSDEQEVELLFKKVLEEMYRAPFKVVDFVKKHEALRREINTWVADKTAQKIQNLLAPGTLSRETRMVLVSAIYFKDKWVEEFSKRATRDEPFTLTRGGTVQVPMMHARSDYRYAETPKCQILEMPYQSGLSFAAVLPTRKDGLPELEAALVAGRLKLPATAEEEVRVWIPRFRLESEFALGQTLAEMGMPLAFSNRADFTGIAEPHEQRLKIDFVVHKAFCEVNEEGTEAAAATAVGMVRLASYTPEPQPKVFRADHPFLFMIGDRAGNILFLGRVENPA